MILAFSSCVRVVSFRQGRAVGGYGGKGMQCWGQGLWQDDNDADMTTWSHILPAQIWSKSAV